MGGKKKAPEKKKGGDDDGDDPAEMNAMLEQAVDGLKQRLVIESERKDKSQTAVKLIQDNEKEMREDMITQEKDTKKCIEDMTEQYKRMEQKLQGEIQKLQGEVKEQEEQVETYNNNIKDLHDQKAKI